MKNVVIFGSSGHAKVVADIIEKQGIYNIVGFLDDYKEVGEEVYGYEVLGGIDFYKSSPNDLLTIVAVGDNRGRKAVINKILELKPNIEFATAIHPKSVIAKGVNIGKGTVVMAGAIINSDAVVGEHCIINTKSSVGHDTTISDFVTISPNSTLAGDVKIGESSIVAMNSAVLEKRTIGRDTLIGAGATVVNDIGSGVLAYGTPAREIRKRTPNDKYLR